jgi:large subunit ribosomal protein L28
MSIRCDLCGKKPSFGNNVSHSHKKTRRRWLPNIQNVQVKNNKFNKKMNVCTSCIKAGKVK